MANGPLDRVEYERFEFDVIERHINRVRPDLSGLRIDLQGYFDDYRSEYVDQLKTWIAGKKTSKTVHFNETVSFSFFVPKAWFDHLLIEHKWLQWVFFWREPGQEEISDIRYVNKSETVEFAALIPELQIPEHFRRDGRKVFEVYHTVL